MKTLILQKEGNSSWFLQLPDNHGPVGLFLPVVTSTDAKKMAVEFCKAFASKEKPISLKIRGKDGKFKEERTYPRSADPRSSKG